MNGWGAPSGRIPHFCKATSGVKILCRGPCSTQICSPFAVRHNCGKFLISYRISPQYIMASPCHSRPWDQFRLRLSPAFPPSSSSLPVQVRLPRSDFLSTYPGNPLFFHYKCTDIRIFVTNDSQIMHGHCPVWKSNTPSCPSLDSHTSISSDICLLKINRISLISHKLFGFCCLSVPY